MSRISSSCCRCESSFLPPPRSSRACFLLVVQRDVGLHFFVIAAGKVSVHIQDDDTKLAVGILICRAYLPCSDVIDRTFLYLILKLTSFLWC